MKTKTLKKALSIILTFMLAVTALIPTAVFAEEEDTASDNVNGVFTVGEQQIKLTNKKTKYYVNDVNVGEAISFDCADDGAVYSVDSSTVKRVPMLVSLCVTAENGDAWTYEIRLCDEDVYKIYDVGFAGSTDPTPYRIYPSGDFSTNTAMTFDEITAIEERYGDISPTDAEYWAGTSGYKGYPSKSGSDDSWKIVTNGGVAYSSSYYNTTANVINGESFIFKHDKTQYNKGNYYAGGVGNYDGTDGCYYLSFKINKPGTMYLVDTEGKGMPNATSEEMGYSKDTSVKIIDKSKSVYSKKYTIPEGESYTTVNVPSYGWDESWGYSTTGNTRNFMNPSFFVFIFDTDNDASVSEMSYTSFGKKQIINIDEETKTATIDLAEKFSEIEIDVTPTSSTATVLGNKISLEDGSGSGVVTVVSGDGIEASEYTLTFNYIGDEMLYNGQGSWVDGMYVEEGTSYPNAFAAIKSLSKTKGINVVSDRENGSYWYASSEFLGATYLMTKKNGWGQSSYKFITPYRDNGDGTYVSDTEAEYTVTVGSGEPQTFKAGEASAYTGTGADDNGVYSIKTIKTSVADSDCFTTNETYVGFDVNADCRVFVSDRHGGGYPNLDRNEWAQSDGSLNFVDGTLYWRDYEAGDTVSIPTYGMSNKFTDPEKDVKIEYTDANGNIQTVEYNLGEMTTYMDYLYVAVVWKKDSTLTDLAVDGKTIEGFDSEKTSYSADFAEGTTPVVTYTAAEGCTVTEDKGEMTDGKMVYTYTVKNSVYSTVYTIEFTQTERKAKITVDTNGANITSETNGTVKNLEAINTSEYAKGSEIKFTASAGEGQSFMYWKEVSDNSVMVVSETEELFVKAASDRHFTAVFTDSKIYTVSFRANGRILAEGSASSVTVPNEPYVAGYEFAGWYLDGTKAKLEKGSLTGAAENAVYYAGFVLKNTNYKITVYNGNETVEESCKYNTKLSVTAQEEKDGKVFVYWEKDGEIVSYSREYSFYVNFDAKLTAVYAEEAAEDAVIITIADPTQVEGENKIAFYAERNVPEKYTVVETGILLSRTSGIDLYTNEIKAIAKSTANVGQYTVRKAGVNDGEVWYAVSYVVYKDADGNVYTAYSKEKSASLSADE